MASKNYTVTGMTCEHCVAAVSEEVGRIAGVTGVEVELDGGALTVDGEFTDAQIAEAVDEAGYALA